MMSQSAIHSALIQCAMQCQEFAHMHRHDGNLCSDSVVLSIDCAELCRQVSLLYRSGSVSAKPIAKQCIRSCEVLIQQLSRCAGFATSKVVDSCLQAKSFCYCIAEQTAGCDKTTDAALSTVCYGIILPIGVYRT